MADGGEQNVVKEIQDGKDLNESNSSRESFPRQLLQKQHQPSFASPVTKRPFADNCSQGDQKFGKRMKYNLEGGKPAMHKTDLKETSEEKRELVNILKKKEDMLRKLNLVKLYRAKNNLSDLEDLINKWRSISQTAAQDLFEKLNNDKVLTMALFLDGMRISHDLIKYSEEDETFY